MKSVIKTNDLKGEIKYPMLMTAENQRGKIVVLFTDNNFGTVVYSERERQPVGYYSKRWDVSGFFPFNGTIELSNN